MGLERSGAEATLEPGELLAGRYRIVRFIARGGMGEVYEADDEELGEQLALKLLRPEIAADAALLERFKRETLLAHRVTHPGVCRVFDFCRLSASAADGRREPPLAFLTMELLEGETLAERLERSGRMRPEEAVPVLRQVAAALAAAHAAGVIHRDLKSSNVVLVPAEDGVRVVVTDFGLAREELTEGDSTLSLTARGDVIGTPAYMAPEQVEGTRVTVRTDLYSFGVLMYELLTGRRPFVGSSPLSTAVQRLNQEPVRPRVHVPDLSRRLEAIVLRCLRVDPDDRFQSAAELARALSEVGPTAGRTAERGRGRRWVVRLVWAALAVAVALLTSLLWLGLTERDAPLPRLSTARRSVAVLGFKNLTGRADAAWLSTAVSEMLKTELAADGRLRLLSGEQVERMKLELELADADTLAGDSLHAIAAYLNADLVVLGSYVSLETGEGTRVRLDLRVQETASGETVGSVAVTRAEEELFDLVAESGRKLREALGVPVSEEGRAAGLRAALPSSAGAVRLYTEGLRRLRRFDAAGARDILVEAVVADPDYPLAHAALAAGWRALGYDERARAEAKTAFDLSGSLPREGKLTVEGRYREVAGEWERAEAIYRSLWTFYPDNLEYGLRLAGAEVAAGRGHEALAVVEELRHLPAPTDDDPRIDLLEARAAQALSDYRRQLEAAERAVAKGERLGARLLAANARLLQGAAVEVLEGPEQAEAVYEAAKERFEQAGDRGSMARATVHLADVLMRRGDAAGARARYEQALAVFEQIGDRRSTATTLSAIAWLLFGQEGDLEGAEQRHRQALAIFEEIGDHEQTAVALRNLGGVLWRRGDADAAEAKFGAALEGFRELGNRQGEARVLRSLGWLALIRGRLPAAQTWLEQALAIDREIEDRRGEGRDLQVLAMAVFTGGELDRAGAMLERARRELEAMNDRSGVALALYGLGRVALDRGDLAAAAHFHRAALAMREEMGETGWSAESRLRLAEVLVEQGELEPALEQQRAALESFGEKTRPDGRAWAEAEIARATLLGGDVEGAAAALAKAGSYGTSGQRVDIRLALALTAARVAAAAGRRSEAEMRLRRVVDEASASGIARIELEARFVEAELAAHSGERSEGRQRLVALASEARQRGFGLLAAKADRALAKTGAAGQGR